MAVLTALIQNADTWERKGCMQSLSGTMWRVTEARAFDEAGQKLLPLGPHPIGLVIFEVPISGLPGQSGIEVVWERVS